jgi:hypothetical protein
MNMITAINKFYNKLTSIIIAALLMQFVLFMGWDAACSVVSSSLNMMTLLFWFIKLDEAKDNKHLVFITFMICGSFAMFLFCLYLFAAKL